MQLMDRVTGISFFIPPAWSLHVADGLMEASRWRQSAALPAPVLVPRPPRGLRAALARASPALRRSSRPTRRKPLWGYKSMVYACAGPRFPVSFIVWAHHMYLTGMGTGGLDLLPDHHRADLGALGDPADLACSSRCGAARSASRRRCSGPAPSCRCSESAG